MLDLGSTQFNFDVNSIHTHSLEALSSHLFDEWQDYVDQSLRLPDYSLFLEIEEGSIIGRGKIASAAKHLLIGISAYGGFMAGLDYISKQLAASSSFLAKQAQVAFACDTSQATVHKKRGAPAKLHNLFNKVQNGSLTPEEASILAERILGEEAADAPGFIDAISKALTDCPRPPEQTHLQFDDLMEISPAGKVSGTERRKPSKRAPPDPLAPLHYRIEVWRNSKEEKKRTKITTW